MTQKTKSYQKIQKYYSPGEIIFTENSDCDGMYIVNEGAVSVFKTIRDGDGTREIELVRVGKNGMFGEMALLDQNKRSASVRAIESTKVTILTTEMFDDQLRKLPPWVLNVVQLLIARLRSTNNKLRNILIENNNTPPPDVQDTGLLVVKDDKPEPVQEVSAEPDTRPGPDSGSEKIQSQSEDDNSGEDQSETDKVNEAAGSGGNVRLFADEHPVEKLVKKEPVSEPLSKETDKLLDGLDF